MDSAELTAQLRAAHNQGKHNMGIGEDFLYFMVLGLFLDINKGEIADVVELGIIESFNVKYCMVSSAAEAAEQILRVDDIIKCAPRARPADHRPC